MSTDRDVTRAIRSWLHEDGHEDADRVLGLVIDQIDTTPQRRAAWPVRRIILMSTNARLGLVAAAIILAVVVGIGLSGKLSVGPSGPTPSTAPSPEALSSTPEVVTARTRYLDSTFSVPFTFSVPGPGWKVALARPSEFDVYAHARANYGVGIRTNFLIYADPCHWDLGFVDATSLKTVDGIVAAFARIPGFTASQPTAATAAGHASMDFDLTPPVDANQCTPPGFMRLLNTGEPSSEDQFPINVHLHYQVIDVGGTAVLIEQYSFEGAERLAEVQQVVDTIIFR